MTLSRPRTTSRVLRGSALGLGLLVVGGITAPAAFAIEDTSDDSIDRSDEESLPPAPLVDTPGEETATLAPALTGDFGTGKDFSVQVAPNGPHPDDLDLSGAVFRATPVTRTAPTDTKDLAGDDGSYTCTTDVSGWCTFDSDFSYGDIPDFPDFSELDFVNLDADDSNQLVPVGTYTLTQVSASPGLAPNTGSATFGICNTPFCGTPSEGHADVGNDSLFRSSLVTTVTDVDTGEPIACAGYELTGPDYPHDGTAPVEPAPAATTPAACLITTSTEPTVPSSSSAPTTTSAPETTTDDADETTDGDTSTEDSTTASSSSTSPSSSSELVVPLAGDDDPVSFGTGISDTDGELVIEGWLIPGEGYLLTPTSTPDGYSPDVTDTFGIATTAMQAATNTPAAVARSLYTLAGGATPTTSGGLAGAATASAPVAGASVPTSSATASSAATAAALATTGTPVTTMALLGTGLVALGGGAMATSTIVRRRARANA